MPIELLKTIEDYTQVELESFLTALRTRRETLHKALKAGRSRAANPSSPAAVRELIEKYNIKLEKALVAADKALDKAETCMNALIAARLQVQDATPMEIRDELS